MRLRILGALLAVLSAGVAQAQLPTIPVAPVSANAPPPPPQWNGELAAGYVATSGNSDTRTSNARTEIVYQTQAWKNTFNAAAIQSQADQLNELTGQEETQVTAERYTATDKA